MPRAGLTHDRVVELAAEVADQVGLDRLTLALVAQRCGVALPSLYKHVSGLDGVQRGIATIGAEELAVRLSTAAVGRSGQEALLATARAYRAFAHERPGRYRASVRAPSPDDPAHLRAATEVFVVVRAVVDGYRLPPAGAVDAIRALRSALHGFVSLEASGGFGMPDDLDASFEAMVLVFDRAWSPSVSHAH